MCCSKPLTNTNASSESAGASVNVKALVDLSPEKLLVETLLIVPVVPLPPVIVIVLVAPYPVAVTLSPTKFNVVAEVDRELPSS